MTYIEVDEGVRLLVQDLGTGTPVVLIPGFGMTHQVWDRQVRVLSQNHRVVCLDQRGHGHSDKPLDGYDIERLAKDLCVVLDTLDISECAVVAWSFAGQVAFRAAAGMTDRIGKLALVGSNAVRASRSADFPFGRAPELLEPALITAETTDRLAARRTAIASAFAREPDEELVRWLLSHSLQMPSWAAVACYHTMLYADLIDRIPNVSIPVLQVIGTGDRVHSAKGARWLNERLNGAELVELPDCGHYPMFESPDDFDSALSKFVADRT
ncbi:alpha/beta hydrolase [Mycobacterium syngnathidarum]